MVPPIVLLPRGFAKELILHGLVNSADITWSHQ